MRTALIKHFTVSYITELPRVLFPIIVLSGWHYVRCICVHAPLRRWRRWKAACVPSFMCLALQAQTHTRPAFAIRERTNQEASRPEVCMCVCVCAMIYTLYVFGGFILNYMNFITHFCKFVLVRIYLYKDMQGRRISVYTEYKKEKKKKCFSSSTSPSCVDLLQFGICLMQTPCKAGPPPCSASSSPSPCPLSASSTLARTLTKQRTTSCS